MPVDVRAQAQGAEGEDQRVDDRPGHVEISARLAAFCTLVPPVRAELHQLVEDRRAQRAVVYECTAKLVRDLGFARDHGGDSIPDRRDRVHGWVRYGSCHGRDHDVHDVLVDGLDSLLITPTYRGHQTPISFRRDAQRTDRPHR